MKTFFILIIILDAYNSHFWTNKDLTVMPYISNKATCERIKNAVLLKAKDNGADIKMAECIEITEEVSK